MISTGMTQAGIVINKLGNAPAIHIMIGNRAKDMNIEWIGREKDSADA